MTHTTLTQSNLSVSSAVVKPSFSGGSKLARESFATLARAKQKTVHCSGLLARKISDKNADMDHHAVRPPEYQAGGDSRRENLCQQDSARVNKTTPRASSSGQLDATEDPAVENIVHLHPNTAGDKYSKKFHDPAKNFKPQNKEEHEIYNQVLNSFCASVVKYPTNLQSFPLNVAILEQIFERLLMGFVLPYKGSRRRQKDGDE